MERIERPNGNRIGRVVLLTFCFAAHTLWAMNPDQEGWGMKPEQAWRRREASRRAQLAAMGSVLRTYSATDWSALTELLAGKPDGATNAELMFIPLSLGNVHLNAWELRRSRLDLERSLDMFDFVVGHGSLWTGRTGAGGVVAYLQISLARFDPECDVGDLGGRIADLRELANEITLSEARSRDLRDVPPSADRGEMAADGAALLAAAANFLPPWRDTASWESRSRELGARALAGCPSATALLFASEAALSFRLTGHIVPDEYRRVSPLPPLKISLSGIARLPCAHSGWLPELSAEMTEEMEESVAAAFLDSRMVALSLTEYFLWSYPAGCGGEQPKWDINI